MDLSTFLAHDYNKTRLVGFRTATACRQAHQIRHIMPIYLSTDEDMCKSHLRPVTREMLTELPRYGNDCDETELFASRLPQQISIEANRTGEMRFTELTYAAVWLMFLEILVILCLRCA